MTSGQNPSAGRTRAVLAVVLVAVLAAAAAIVTVLLSAATYPPAERTISPRTQVAAGVDHVDPVAGLIIRVPEGWRAESSRPIFGSTALTPVRDEEPVAGAERSDGVVLVGALTDELFDLEEPDNEVAALTLASGMGQILLPIPGRTVEERVEPISSRVGDGWSVSFRVLPTAPQGLVGPDGALVYSAVVGEGTRRYWLTYVGLPGDGAIDSPRAEWADEIVERLRPSEAYYAPLGPGEPTTEPA